MHRVEANALLRILDTVGMYVHGEASLSKTITFITGYTSGLGVGNEFGQEFRAWLLTLYYDKSNNFYWGMLVEVLLEEYAEEEIKIIKLRELLADFFDTKFVSSGLTALTDKQTQALDQVLLKNIGQQFGKVARIVGVTTNELANNDIHLSDLDCLARLHVLIEKEALDVQGDVFNMRFCEVKLGRI